MNDPGHYPPPDFDSPPPGSFQSRSSSFHPNMWSWTEAPSESGWISGAQAGWHHGAPPGYGAQGCRGGYGPKRPYGQNFGHEWYQGGRQNYRPHSNQGKKQRNKKEPEFSHFCDTCDRGFKNQEKYDEHVSQHVKCSVPDCSFTAHEKIVSIHWKNSHAPGTKRIKLDTPEEIAKWREERRKNYPTVQNIEKKKKVMAVREETGGVLETAQFRRMRGRGRGRGRGWGCGRGRGQGTRGFQDQHPPDPNSSDDSATARPPLLSQASRDGDPLGALASSDHDSDKEESIVWPKTGGLVVPPKQMSSALGSLIANYGSMTESESDEEPETMPIKKAKDLVHENQVLLNTIALTPQNGGPRRGVEPSSLGTETKKTAQPEPPLSTSNNRRGTGRGGRGGRGGKRQDTHHKHSSTLLEMLLAPDIRHERNVLLQCVRYVVRNNFFGLERKPQLQDGSEATPAIATKEREKRQIKPSEEVGSVSHTHSPADKERSSTQNSTTIPGTGNQADSETTEAVVVNQDLPQNGRDQSLHTEQVLSQKPEDPPKDSSCGEQVSSDCQRLDVKFTDKITSVSNVYDDEIWESPGVVL